MEASRIANVTAVVAPARTARGRVRARVLADARALARLCGALFEQVVWLDGEEDAPPGCRRVRPERGAEDERGDLRAAALAAEGERLLWIGVGEGPAPGADALLALVAWPERVGVQPVDAAGRALPFAIHRRADWLPDRPASNGPDAAARSPAARPERRALERIPLAALGLDDASTAVFAWRDRAE
ncbi:MAG: hypothetical protein R3F35_19505 [Myxococcota bacterium]